MPLEFPVFSHFTHGVRVERCGRFLAHFSHSIEVLNIVHFIYFWDIHCHRLKKDIGQILRNFVYIISPHLWVIVIKIVKLRQFIKLRHLHYCTWFVYYFDCYNVCIYCFKIVSFALFATFIYDFSFLLSFLTFKCCRFLDFWLKFWKLRYLKDLNFFFILLYTKLHSRKILLWIFDIFEMKLELVANYQIWWSWNSAPTT